MACIRARVTCWCVHALACMLVCFLLQAHLPLPLLLHCCCFDDATLPPPSPSWRGEPYRDAAATAPFAVPSAAETPRFRSSQLTPENTPSACPSRAAMCSTPRRCSSVLACCNLGPASLRVVPTAPASPRLAASKRFLPSLEIPEPIVLRR